MFLFKISFIFFKKYLKIDAIFGCTNLSFKLSFTAVKGVINAKEEACCASSSLFLFNVMVESRFFFAIQI